MNVEMLRKGYKELTPFERAVMITNEALTRQRKAEIDALRPPSMWDSLWVEHWNSGFFTVAAYAMWKSLYAEKVSLQIMALYLEGKTLEDPAPDLGWEAERVAVGWLKALRRLGDEVGAPFLELTKIFDREYAFSRLSSFEEEEIDESQQDAALVEMWQAVAKDCNTSDCHRAADA